MTPITLITALLLLRSGGPLIAAPVVEEAVRQESRRPYVLARIEFRGLRRVTRARALAVTRLRAGSRVTALDVDAASARLVDSGFFSSVQHRYSMEGWGLVVTFVLQEAAWTTPVVFDNFVGYEDNELRAVLADRFPLFDGHAPDQPAVLTGMASLLQASVKGAWPSASVGYVGVDSTPYQPRHYRFRVQLPGKTLPICRVQVTGLPESLRADAEVAANPLVGSDYSRDFVSEYAARNVAPVAQREGHYRARVASATVTRSGPDSDCPSGADVMLRIERGRPYKFGGVEWAEATPAEAHELTRLTRLAPGAPAEPARFDEAATVATQWLRRQGYIAARVQSVASVEEAAATVSCRLTLVRGPRFRLRTLEILGLEPDLASRVRARWTGRTGDSYDPGELHRFVASIREAEGPALAGRTTVTIRERADTAKATVDVTLDFARPPSRP